MSAYFFSWDLFQVFMITIIIEIAWYGCFPDKYAPTGLDWIMATHTDVCITSASEMVLKLLSIIFGVISKKHSMVLKNDSVNIYYLLKYHV